VNIRSLKFRLIAWYAGWLTLLFVIFGLFVYQSLDHYLRESLRAALARRVRQVADTAQRLPPDPRRLALEIENHFAPEINNRLTRVTIGGTLAYESGPPSDLSFTPRTVPPLLHAVDGETFESRVASDGKTLLVVSLQRVSNGETMLVEEGSAEAPIEATLGQWLAALIGGLIALILGAVLGGFLLVQRSLRPVDRITRSAERITSRNLSERLPLPNTRDEIMRLSIALNSMIRRLDESFQHNQRFLADASHELRTPLTMMHAELEEALRKPGDQDYVRDLVNSALQEVERLRKIVEGLFALSRLDAGEALEEIATFDLSDLASATAEQMCLLAEDKKITITCQPSEQVLVTGDRSRLKQVVVNLLDNAIKYTPEGGSITIRTFSRENAAILQVSDNGVGIPPEALPHLFERFYRADKARSRLLGGAGLGLSIVHSICLAHGGQVTVRSRNGEGTEFTVELPLPKTQLI
jgi:heavy metal sensor kinase